MSQYHISKGFTGPHNKSSCSGPTLSKNNPLKTLTTWGEKIEQTSGEAIQRARLPLQQVRKDTSGRDALIEAFIPVKIPLTPSHLQLRWTFTDSLLKIGKCSRVETRNRHQAEQEEGNDSGNGALRGVECQGRVTRLPQLELTNGGRNSCATCTQREQKHQKSRQICCSCSNSKRSWVAGRSQ